ncbi:MAG TPA: LptF/LptG family permease [Ferruginibacter sp.]|jgi:lipopolysaccharide export system permease protein|nr:LptF/LptG family permease [Bacteroidota bacterium]MBS1924398.1 LptF/LptG family permease [Bacteroidota bacterium]MCC6692449.1 LptF/LptG family permease [Chitinophagaceae bacterium]HMT95723.1 LptF/LptG family permease [Ferruginibacter sp.]HMU24091.1 LptF/LptG family permease [Ferruginibacter sp.]
MKKIDQYIISKYLSTFFFCLLLFTVIVVVVDISEKTDDFVKSNLDAWQIFKEYYLGFIPRFDAMLFPLFVFISVIFFTSKMAGRSEIIAILSSGVSFRRFMVPYMVSALFLSLLLWLGYRSMVPKANEKFGNFNKNYVDVNKGMHNKNTSYLQNLYFRLDPVTYVGLRSYDTISKSGNGFFVDQFKNNKLQYNLRAASIMWDTGSKKWKLSNVLERHMDSLTERVVKNSNLLMNYNFRPLDLRKDEYLKDQMPTRELDDFIKREKMRHSEGLSDLLVERYNRDAIPVSVFILTIIGASLASRKLRGGSGAHLALGVIISVSYILFSRFSVVFATKGNFSPFMAAWLPNILFGLLAFYIYKKAPK